MASSLVLILLLDNIPGNITLGDIKPFGQHLTDAQLCTSNQIVDPILNVVNRKLDIKIIPKWRRNQEKLFNMYFVNKTRDILKETSFETLYNIQAVLDNSAEIENSNSFEKSKLFFENRIKYLNSNAAGADNSQLLDGRRKNTEVIKDKQFPSKANATTNLNLVVNKTDINIRELNQTIANQSQSNTGSIVKEFPPKVSFLVAIFESLSNVTAQTCGGTVLSPRWVLTSASCVNVLETLYNFTNAEKSQYTIIANTSNPVVDGTIHRVTEVLLHPDPNVTIPVSVYGLISHLHNTFEDSKRDLGVKEKEVKVPVLALMKVDPEILVGPVEICEDNVLENSTDVWLYGWELSSNDTGNGTMVSSSFPAQTMSVFDCELQYGVTDRSSVCLTSNNTVRNVTQISSGSPVVSLRGGKLVLSGVAQTDDHCPLLAHPMYAHAPWIRRTINVTLI